MARTPSNMLPLGSIAPAFSLIEPLSQQTHSLDARKGEKGTLVMFICNHCPFVIHIMDELTALANKAVQQGIGVIAISSNDVENYPEDSPEKMAEFAQRYGFEFPYLYDESQETAKAYDAACTPDFYLFDQDLACVYRGQFDSSRPGSDIPVTGEDLSAAVDCLVKDRAIDANQTPSLGCNIKWRS